MATRGRPPSNGVQDGWKLLRVMVVLDAFYLARKNGKKFEVAMQEAVEQTKIAFPKKSISITTAKRILAEFWSKDGDEAMVVQDVQSIENITLAKKLQNDTSQKQVLATVSFKPRPKFSRANKPAK